MKVDGACHCGHLKFETEINPETVRVCHCTDCQTFSGSAFRIAVSVDEQDFKLLSGEPKIYIKTADNGNKREQVFCPKCGTYIYATSAKDQSSEGPRKIGIRVPTLTQRNELTPSRQIWHRSAQPWLNELSSLPSDETQ